MKKFFNSIKFISKAFLLIMLLLVGWAFVNVTNLVKGKKSAEKGTDNLFGADKANAEIPEPPPPPSCVFCPDVAVFDGKKFVIENDFLCGSPAYAMANYAQADFPLFKKNFARPDLLKFSSSPKKVKGRLTLQLQENEEEESFIDWLKFIRVLHPQNTEVLIDSSFEKFHVVDRDSAEKNIALPSRILINGHQGSAKSVENKKRLWADLAEDDGLFLKRADRVEYIFNGLARDKAPFLVIKSVFRDWMMGEVPEEKHIFSYASLFRSPLAGRMAIFILAAIYMALGRKTLGGALAFTPFIVGSGSMCKSIIFSYSDKDGVFHQAVINKPRARKYGTEVVSLPKEAIREDGTAHIAADFTKAHCLGFVGILQELGENSYRSENLEIENAKSSRFGDVTRSIFQNIDGHVHMIPGDTVDVTWKEPKFAIEKGEKETYLFQSFGFYTPLRATYKELAGNWQERISDEAKNRLASLVKLKDYV